MGVGVSESSSGLRLGGLQRLKRRVSERGFMFGEFGVQSAGFDKPLPASAVLWAGSP